MDNVRRVCLTCKKEFDSNVIICPDDGGQLMPQSSDPLVGTLFADKYEILSVLGSGGMSVIYKARHHYMERICALKLLHPFLVADASMFQRFQYEAKAASNLSHPNVVATHDFGITGDGRAYLVMDYLEGEDLSTLLERQVFLTEPQAREIFRQTLAGLDHAHSKGVIHRDLKPSNLFLIPQEDSGVLVKLVDFGIAKMSAAAGGGQNLTQTGEVFGSPLYMSPEQCAGKTLDARSDLYSLGCLMYEALSGRRPLVGESALETMHMHLKETPLTLSQAAPKQKVSEELENAVMKCLLKRPDDRYASAAELYLELYKEPIPKAGTSHNLITDSSALLKIQVGAASLAHLTTSGTEAANRSTRFVDSLRLTKKQVIPVAASLLIGIIASMAGLYWCVAIWPGPENDRGTLVNRWIYTFWISRGEELARQGQFKEAGSAYDKAETVANTFGDNFGRKVNVLRAKLKLYGQANLPKQSEAVLKQMAEVNRDRALADCEAANTEIDRIAALYEKSKAATASGGSGSVLDRTVNTGYELALQLGTKIEGIIGVSRRLGSVQAYDDQEALLEKAGALYSQLAGNDDPQLADLKTELAYSHWQQDEISFIRPLLNEALTININCRKRDKGPASLIAEAQSWLRLGQFDRDRSNFADAERELNTALAYLKQFRKLDRSRDDSVHGYELLKETYNALADLMTQKKNTELAMAYRKEVVDMKKAKVDYHPEPE